MCLYMPLAIWLFSIWSSLLTTTSTCLHFTYSSHVSVVSTIFFIICATPTLFNVVIYNSNVSSLTTYSTQHLHFRYSYMTLMLVFHRPTPGSIQHHWFYRCLVKKFLRRNLSDALVSHKTPGVLLHLNHQVWVWWFAYAYISLLFYTIDPKHLNHVTYGMIWSLTFTFKVELLHFFVKITFRILCLTFTQTEEIRF